MIKRVVSYDGTVVADVEHRASRQPMCEKCKAPLTDKGSTMHYVTCPLWKEWQAELRRKKNERTDPTTSTTTAS